MNNKFFGVLQRVGRSFMLPIAVLPVAGLLLGIGSSFTNPTTIETYNLTGLLGDGTFLHGLLVIMAKVGSVIFDNLALLFAVGVAIGMAKAEKEVAAISSVIAYLVMNTAIFALLVLSGTVSDSGEVIGDAIEGTIASACGIPTLQMGVFGGIIVGLGVAFLHNRFYKIRLPDVLSFFGGTRFVPIISTVAYVLVGGVMFLVWPYVQNGIYALGDLVLKSGYAGTLIYGFTERILIPFGLHHVFYLPFWQTGVGGSAMIDGTLIYGAQNIFFAELASPATEVFSVSATRFMSGKFPLMIFGLPGAALAMYTCARPEKKKTAGSLLFSAALTSVLTGITEPLEFTFLFVAPVLYVIHSVLAGAAYMLMHILKVGVGMTFSGGLIDLFLFGILQGNTKTRWIMVPLVGIGYFVLYFFLFRLLIQKRNYLTPGREEDNAETKLYTRADYNKKKNTLQGTETPAEKHRVSRTILEGLGGRDNVVSLDCCATRLRVTVQDSGKVRKDLLTESGAAGVIAKGTGVQVIYGPRVSVIKSELEEYMQNG